MKKLCFVFMLLSVQSTFAQNEKVDLAREQLKNYNEKNKPKDLAKARENIDAASLHAETKDGISTWILRGDIYMASYTESGITNRNPELSATLSATDSFLQTATFSYLQAKKLDFIGRYGDQIARSFILCNTMNQTSGIENYNAGYFGVAANCFGRSFDISVAQGKADSLILYDAALAGYKAKMFDKAIGWSEKLTATNYSQKDSWWLLTQCYVESGDTAAARKSNEISILRDPENTAFMYQKIDIHLASGDFKIADEITRKLVQGGLWTDAFTNLSVGSGYDQMANPVGSDGSALEKPWNYETLINRAEFYYREALRIQPRYFEAEYNLGILYYNQGAEYNKRSDSNRPDAVKYQTMWEPLVKKAVVELELANKFKPKDKETLTALKMCYRYVGDSDNYQRVKGELDGL